MAGRAAQELIDRAVSAGGTAPPKPAAGPPAKTDNRAKLLEFALDSCPEPRDGRGKWLYGLEKKIEDQ
jgi:hypothetical protein